MDKKNNGGYIRAQKLSPERRKEIAQAAARARWGAFNAEQVEAMEKEIRSAYFDGKIKRKEYEARMLKLRKESSK